MMISDKKRLQWVEDRNVKDLQPNQIHHTYADQHREEAIS